MWIRIQPTKMNADPFGSVWIRNTANKGPEKIYHRFLDPVVKVKNASDPGSQILASGSQIPDPRSQIPNPQILVKIRSTGWKQNFGISLRADCQAVYVKVNVEQTF
jgi:hypothetical protein